MAIRICIILIAKPPKPHPSFAIYGVEISKNYGVIAIIASSKDITTSVYGEAIRNEFDKIKNQISISYGQSKDYDLVKTGSIWDEPKDWMMALLKEERALGAFWAREYGSILPDDISLVWLGVYYKLKIPENIKKISLVISAGIPWKNQGQLKTASW